MSPAESITDVAMTKSNCYSVSECILLKWMSYHYNLINPLHTRSLTNFGNELRDGTVFNALIRSHYGEP
jgi:hypothetical protein